LARLEQWACISALTTTLCQCSFRVMSPGNPRRPSALNVANALTYFRVFAVPVVVACFFWEGEFRPGSHSMRWIALAIFIVAAVTDYFDGWAARAFGQVTTVGRMLDPIADKLLVAACLLVLAADQTIAGWSLWAGVIILCREILVSGLREFLAELRVSVPVSKVAKWKTVMQLVAIGFLIAGPAGDAILPHITSIGIVLLWIAAVLTIYTGFDYFRAGVTYLKDERS
jgi:cardiolipin synthase (CMP-forming)